MSWIKWGDIEKRARRRLKNGDYREVKRISIIKLWETVTSGSRVMAILVSCCLRGRWYHLAFFHYSAPTQHPALLTDAPVQLRGSACPQICSLSSPCQLKDTETTFKQSFFFFSFENSTLACNFQSSGLHEWTKGSLTAPSPSSQRLPWCYFLDAN